MPPGRACPLRALAWLPVQRIGDEGKLDSGAIGSHRAGRVGHEVLGVDDDRTVPSSVLHSDEEVVQQPQPGVEDSHVVFEGKP
jgi:hypothetical protein